VKTSKKIFIITEIFIAFDFVYFILNEDSFTPGNIMTRIYTEKRTEKKNRIIEAAVTVFAEKGFYNAKVSDVARAAGVADGTIYIYFKNKDDILISLFESKMEHILRRFIDAVEKASDPIDKLKAFFRLYFSLIKEDKNLAEVFQVELRQSSKFLKDYKNQKFSDYLNLIASIIQEGIESGFFQPDLNVHIIKLIIFGAIDEVARQWILGAESKYSLDEATEQVSRTLVNSLLSTQ
jgi:TetR/AcrR family fatty acid metabolism transcriptional regulator